MKHPFLAALFLTVLLFVGYFAWRGSGATKPPETATPTPSVPAAPVAPDLTGKSVPELIAAAQQQIDEGDYDQALATLAVARKKEPANQQVSKLIARATTAKATEERITKHRQ